MDFLDNSIFPQSAHHLEVLKYLLVLAYLLFIPYLSVLLGSLFFSVIYNRKGNNTGNKKYLKYSKDLIDLLTMNKSIVLVLGIIPLSSIIFSYAQLLHQSGSIVVNSLIFTIILFVVASTSIYIYKYSYHLSDMLGAITGDTKKFSKYDQKLVDEAGSYKNVTTQVYYKSGLWGLIFLFISSYLFIATLQLTFNPVEWSTSNLFEIIFSGNSIINYLYFVFAAFGLTFAAMLYYYFKLGFVEETEEEFVIFARKESAKFGLIFTIALPIFAVLTLILTPSNAISNLAVIVSIIILLLLTIISSIFYSILKESDTRYSNYLFYLFIIVFALSIIKDQSNFSIASQKQVKILNIDFVNYQNKLKEEMGIAVAVISGVDIFNGRCSACHQFDQKLVGPAYNSVLPKYEGKKDDLIQFILNPVKVNNEFPPMPNQGLKPKEAEAIADYLIHIYKGQSK